MKGFIFLVILSLITEQLQAQSNLDNYQPYEHPYIYYDNFECHNNDQNQNTVIEQKSASLQDASNQNASNQANTQGASSSKEQTTSPQNGSKEETNDKDKEEEEKKEPRRRALPAPFKSPPFPSAEYQGYPLIGVPPDDTIYPLEQSIYDTHTQWGDWLKEKRIRTYGWFNVSGNGSNCRNSNMPFSYWLVPNQIVLDQYVLRIERQLDSVQTDHIDYGFRSSFMYGIDYRYMTSGGWTDYQLLKHNQLYGYDFTEQYVDIYFPKVVQGMILRIGRWIACPDIETQFAPDNYMGSHSLLFTFDTYTQTGVMATIMINKYWTIQGAIHAGTDMAPWYRGAVPTGMLGVRWVSCDNKDSIYLVFNDINTAKFRRFQYYGKRAGHDNFNYIVASWQHKFNNDFLTKLEGYFMWQRDAVVGGTPSIGPVRSFGGGGGIGKNIPGTTLTFGVLNYTMYAFSKNNFLTVRNEYWRDVDGERSGFPGTYSSHALGFTFNITPLLQFRPEIGYYRNWNHKTFDLGKKRGMILAGADLTLRY